MEKYLEETLTLFVDAVVYSMLLLLVKTHINISALEKKNFDRQLGIVIY